MMNNDMERKLINLTKILQIKCNNNFSYIDFTKDYNFKLLTILFKDWSTPFKFIERGGSYNGVITDYWAHRSKENYIEYLEYHLPKVLESCRIKVLSCASILKWE